MRSLTPPPYPIALAKTLRRPGRRGLTLRLLRAGLTAAVLALATAAAANAANAANAPKGATAANAASVFLIRGGGTATASA